MREGVEKHRECKMEDESRGPLAYVFSHVPQQRSPPE
jgi:hypothetical protein